MNEVTLTHKQSAAIDKADKAYRDGTLFATFVPEPADAAYEGYDWYGWRCEHWGTKWEANNDDPDREPVRANRWAITLQFETAWGPPIPWYEAMEAKGYKVEAFYHEPGMAFVGKYADGVDDCRDYARATSKTVRDIVGGELADEYDLERWLEEVEKDD